jgi:general secretion pathway protein G
MREVRMGFQRKKNRRRRGMTLIEIIVVVTILAMIAAAVTVAVIPQLEGAKRTTAYSDIKSIEQGLKTYYVKKNKYPDTSLGLKGLVDEQILDKMPKDPWGNDYVYLYEGGKYEVKSYGADGSPGGESRDADLSSKDEPAEKK